MLKPHFYTYKKCFTTLLFIFFFVGLLPPNLNGQVKIKEKIFIDPQNSQIVSENSLFPISLYMTIAPNRSLFSDPISSGEIVDIELLICHRVSAWGCYLEPFPENHQFNATITWNRFPGEDEENIPYFVSGSVESDTLSNVLQGFKFKAPEYQKSSYMAVTLNVNTTLNGEYLSEEAVFVIEPDTSIIVSFNPSSISVGDTVELVLEKMVYGGNIIPYHPLQQFEVGMLEGCINGSILVDDSLGSYFDRVTQPIYFVAADTLYTDTLETDTASVRLRVGLNQEWSDPYSDQTEVLHKKWLAKNGLKENDYPLKKTNKANSYVESACYTGTYISWVYDDVDAILNKLKIELVAYPTQKEINANPTAPVFPIRLKITNGNSGGNLKSHLEVKWTKLGHTFSATATKEFQVFTSIVDFNVNWKDEFNNDIIVGGDEIKLTVWYGLYRKTFPLNSKILGLNPDKQIIKDYMAAHYFPPIDMPLSETVTDDDKILQMQIIVLKESTWRQFIPYNTSEADYPLLIGTDWGLCQLHKSNPTIDELWHWKKNINSGIHILWGNGYDEKYHMIKTKFSNIKKLFAKDGKVPRDPNREEFLKMLSHAYNSNYYYATYEYGIKGKKGKYIEDKLVVNNRKEHKPVYGDDFWTKFKDVEDGAPYPGDWE